MRPLAGSAGRLIDPLLGSGRIFRDTVLVDRVLYLLGQGFIRALQMLVVPLVLFSIAGGTMAMGDTGRFGRVAVRTVVMYMVTTALAVGIALVVANVVRPGLGMDLCPWREEWPRPKAKEAPTLVDTLLNIIPKNPFASLANGEMCSHLLPSSWG